MEFSKIIEKYDILCYNLFRFKKMEGIYESKTFNDVIK